MSKAHLATLILVIAVVAAIPYAARAEQGLIMQKALSLDMAMAIAQGSLDKCRSEGYKCAITVLDATGRTMIALQDDGANLHRFDVARKKAYTALVYRRSSLEVVKGWSAKASEPVPLAEGTIPSPPIEGTIAMGGGIPIFAAKDVIGGCEWSPRMGHGRSLCQSWSRQGCRQIKIDFETCICHREL